MTSRTSLLFAVGALALALLGGAWWLLRPEVGSRPAGPGAALQAPPATDEAPHFAGDAGALPERELGAAEGASSTPQPLAAAGPAPAHATGRVIDRTGAPIGGAHVTPFLSGPGQPYRTRKDLSIAVNSGADGRFDLSPLPGGTELGIEVEHPDRAPLVRETFVVGAGESRDLGDILLEDGLLLLGTVSGPGGAPIEGAEIKLLDLQREQRGAAPAPVRSARTDAEGHYTLEHLALRQYQFDASAEGFAPVTIVLSLVLGTADGRWRQDFALERADGSMLGLVLDDREQPVAGITVRVSQRQRAQNTYRLLTSATGDDGRFSVPGLASGSYDVELQSPHVYLDRPLSLPADGVEHVIRVLPSLSVAGQLRCSGPLPEDFSVRARPDSRSGAGMLGGGELLRPFHGTQPRGAFVFEGLRPGSYRFEVHAGGFAVTTSSDVILGADVPRADLIVDLLRGGSVSGRLLPAPAGARVELRDSDYDPSLSLESTFPTPPAHDLVVAAGADGRFRLEHVPPGDYTLSARPEGAPPLHVRDVRVADEADTDVGTLELPRGGTLFGNVMGPDGRPRAAVRLSVSSANHQQQAVTDAEGAFRMTALPPGEYEVVATPGNLWEALQFEGHAHATVVADKEQPVLVTLSERARPPH